MTKPSKRMGKHPDVIAWEKWRESDIGKVCFEGFPCGQYLENRLWRAFMAGRKRPALTNKPSEGYKPFPGENK